MASFRVTEWPLCANGHVLIEVPESGRDDACPICIASARVKGELAVARRVIDAARKVKHKSKNKSLLRVLTLYDAWYPSK